MYVSRAADYGVRCVLYLSKETNRVVSTNEISAVMSIPKSFVAKILQRLSKKGIVKSTQGVSGGFELLKRPDKVSVLEVVEALQGPSPMNLCVADAKKCNLCKTCVIHPVWVALGREIEERLRRENFADLAGQGIRSGHRLSPARKRVRESEGQRRVRKMRGL